MTEWTPERLEAVRGLIAHMADPNAGGYPAEADVAALARIGLAVLSPDEATVERVARAIYAKNPMRLGGDLLTWEDFCKLAARPGRKNEPMEQARAALQALADGGRDGK